MPTKITVNAASADSLSKAAERIRKYQRALANKNRQFVRELAEEGVNEMGRCLGVDPYPDDKHKEEMPMANHPHVFTGTQEGQMSASLRLIGENAPFIEFGAGSHYNGAAGSSPHPLGTELGFTIGSYGMGQGVNDSWEYTKDGTKYVSHGTQALMPLWNAKLKMQQEYPSKAKSIFSIKGI